MRFLHTADWHIGMGASHVPSVADSVRAARLKTAGKITRLARERRCDLLLIAGDLFDSNAVSNDVVHQVLRILEEAAPVEVYILPGNHDLVSPDSVYERPAFANPPANVHVLRDRRPVYLQNGDVAILPAPVTQKCSETDPTFDFPATPEATHRIGVAHGSLQIEGKYQSDDHPIALDAASRANLDYLALGHWHSYLAVGDVTIMPGTPEPMAFGEESGYVTIVEMVGEQTLVEKIQINTLTWLDKRLDLEPDVDMLTAVGSWATELTDDTLLRLEITGYGTGELEANLQELSDWLKARLLYLALNTTQVRAGMLTGSAQKLISPHPFLAGVLSDLAKMLMMAEPDLGAREAATTDIDLGRALDTEMLRKWLDEVDYDPDIIQNAMWQLLRMIQEVSS
ncbi:MAG: DNA repair exonuclease [Firmicutes bacterium]|nr:DNA repair exonuclease [Bacillota bacterium]